MAALFDKFRLRYGHKWLTFIDGNEDEAVNEWAQVLAGLDGDAIRLGLEALDSDWPPSAHEFARLCREAAGIPDAAEAWRIICRAIGMPGTLRQRYRHPAVLAAARHPDCDVFCWSQLSEREGLRRFAPLYRRIAAGRHTWPAEDASGGLEDRTGKAVTPVERQRASATARAAIAEMRARLGCCPAGGGQA